MSNRQKIVFFFAVLVLGLSLLLPIWTIEIWAPQYPEGLFLHIFANRMEGNVDQVNILNHYIGMHKIIPDQIPELTIIPMALLGMMLGGFFVLIFKSLLIPRIWFFLSMILSGVGFYDFYLWGYRYGHELDPNAPIKIPGFVYQPPLIGHKRLLNIDAYSLPNWGAYALGIGFAVTFWILFQAPLKKIWNRYRKNAITTTAALFILMLMACTPKPEAIKVNIDHCHHCHMQFSDTRFGGEIITDKGRIYKFDSVGCLKGYLKDHPEQVAKQIYVADYTTPETLIKIEEATFLEGSSIAGPMGEGPIAAKDGAALQKLKDQFSGKITDWKSLSP